LTQQPFVQPRFGPLWVLGLSGALGFTLGAMKFPTWHVAVETAQVVAGIVRYPPGNPFYIYHVKLWTILHQICAVLLLSGVSEITLSIVLSGVLGMLSFQALAMVAYALSRDVTISVLAPFVIYLSRIVDHGVVYPVILMDTSDTYGSAGLSTIVLVAGLLGSGCLRLGWVLFGLAPAVHPSLGAWLWLSTGITFLWDSRLSLSDLKPIWKWIAAGTAITLLSLLVQLTITYDVPHVDPNVSARYVRAFVGFWDPHRGAVNPASLGVWMNAGAMILSLVWLIGCADRLTRPAVFLLRMVTVTAALSLSFGLLSRVPTGQLPLSLLILIPARLLNFNVMIYVALLFGLLGTYRNRLWSRTLTLVLAAGLLFGQSRGVVVLEVVSAGLLFFALVTRIRAGAGGTAANASLTNVSWETAGANFVHCLALAVLAWAVVRTWATPLPVRVLADRTNNALFAAAAADTKGLIATSGSFHLVQLYTRRPVLLDGGGLDALPYAAESGPAMAQILRDVYDIDLFRPPAEAKGSGVIPHEVNKRAWGKYSRDRWRMIGREYNVSQVLARSDYTIDLPVAAETPSLRLYRIPD
jgi:hypothetical protein